MLAGRSHRTPYTTLIGMLLAIAIVIYVNPYHGIRHDSILYLGQILAILWPEQFANDLFFSYGSQASFTIFPQLIAAIVGDRAVAETFRQLTILSLIFFAVAASVLVRVVFPAQWHWPALAAALAFPRGYGGLNIFAYAEPFFTARSFADPLLLLAIAAWFSSRRLTGIALGVAASVLHPLHGVAVALILWFDLVRENRRWLHVLWLIFPLLLAAWFTGPPFSSLLAIYDPTWLSKILAKNQHVFLCYWRFTDWGYLLTDALFVWLLAKDRLRAPGGRLALATLWAMAFGLVFTLLFADLLRAVLPTALQLWRVHWVLHWLAMAAVPMVLYSHYQKTQRWNDPVLCLLLAILAVGTPVSRGAGPGAAALLLVPLFLLWPRIEGQMPPRIRRLVVLGLIAATLAAVLLHIGQGIQSFNLAHGNRAYVRPEFVLLRHPLLAGLLLGLVFFLWQRSQSWRYLLGGMVVAFLFSATQQWDRRNDWTLQLESASGRKAIFGFTLPASSQVYWHGELLAPWLILNRSSYFAGDQTVGQVFYRGTANEALRRQRALEVLEYQMTVCEVMNTAKADEDACQLHDGVVARACLDTSPHLNYLVLRARLGSPPVGIWKIKGSGRSNREIVYRLYGCSEVLAFVKQHEVEVPETGAAENISEITRANGSRNP